MRQKEDKLTIDMFGDHLSYARRMRDWIRHLPPELHEMYQKELLKTLAETAKRQRDADIIVLRQTCGISAILPLITEMK